MLYHPSIAASASFRFRNPDFIAAMSASALVPLKDCLWSFALFGTSGALTVDRATLEGLGGTPGLGLLAERLGALARCSYPESFDISVSEFVAAVREGRTASRPCVSTRRSWSQPVRGAQWHSAPGPDPLFLLAGLPRFEQP
jgi:hypothetical protein